MYIFIIILVDWVYVWILTKADISFVEKKHYLRPLPPDDYGSHLQTALVLIHPILHLVWLLLIYFFAY